MVKDMILVLFLAEVFACFLGLYFVVREVVDTIAKQRAMNKALMAWFEDDDTELARACLIAIRETLE